MSWLWKLFGDVISVGIRGQIANDHLNLADRASDQSGGQSFISSPEVVCASGLGLANVGRTLPGAAGLGIIGRKSMRCQLTNEVVCTKSEENIFFNAKILLS